VTSRLMSRESTTEGDLGRKALPGFGAIQWDITTLRRQICLTCESWRSVPKRFL
jgi:hypothetical protein